MVDPKAGLDDAEAARRLAEFGPNALDETSGRSIGHIVRSTLREPMFLLLLGASGLYLFLGDLAEGVLLTVAALATVALVVVQEARSERALRALRELAEPDARVVRAGAERTVPIHELVPGDIILVGEGQRLPADARLIDGEVLSVDESALTGESAPLAKTPQAAIAAATESVDAQLFAGTLIVGGQGVAEVSNTGARTALGQIGASLAKIEGGPTPLQKSAGRLVGVLGFFALLFCGLVTVAYGLLRGDWVEGALAGVTVAISLIPEEFPMVLAVFMALGAWRLARHKVLVRRGAVIEALGGATILCVDKTGTLTENRMTLARLWAEGEVAAPGEMARLPAAAERLLETAILASAERPTDPMDRALRAFEAVAPDCVELERVWPLRACRLAVVQRWNAPEGPIAATKGAPEAVFHLCRLPEQVVNALRDAVDVMAADGLRVLAVAAARDAGAVFDEPEDGTFVFQGLVGFLDPVRPDVPAALLEARAAGIAVAMITGDYPATALEIARQAGIDVGSGVLTGEEITALDKAALCERVRQVRVFARVRPEQKLALVEAMKANGEVVAMTGDGINDAPALEAAHIGIAMGRRGTDVAREAADLVLLDDSFASIVGGVRLGRRIFANLRKALIYVTAIHVPIAGLALLPILFGLPPMVFPIHVVLLELVIDPICSLVFEAEPSEAGAMRRPPKRASEALFGARQVALAVLQGVVVLVAVFGLYLWALEQVPEAQARGAAFACLVLANLMLALADSASAGVRLFDPHRRVFWLVGAGAMIAVALGLFVPAAANLFRFAAPPPGLLLAALGVALAAGGWFAPLRGLSSVGRFAAPRAAN